MTRIRATQIGFVAVLLWSLLAVLTVGTAPIPPLQLNAICFGIGGIIGVLWTWKTGSFKELLSVPWFVYAFGTVGLFGYHFLYFSALRNAPAAQAGLIAYLWPLLIVLLSGLLPGEKLRSGHIWGAAVSFAGAALVILGGASEFETTHIKGFLFAAGCALTWATYSVISRRFSSVPPTSVAVFCLLSAALSAGAHLAIEDTIWPTTNLGWASVIALGVGPVGLAFYVWDIGVKLGDIQLLGVVSYAAPLLSTVILIGAGLAELRWPLLLAAALISGGALMAAKADTSREMR